jgi:hypothetical protein
MARCPRVLEAACPSSASVPRVGHAAHITGARGTEQGRGRALVARRDSAPGEAAAAAWERQGASLGLAREGRSWAARLGRGWERTVGPLPTCAWAKRGGESRLGLVRGMGLGEMAMTRWVACDGPGHELGWRVGGRGGGKGSWPTKIEKGFFHL